MRWKLKSTENAIPTAKNSAFKNKTVGQLVINNPEWDQLGYEVSSLRATRNFLSRLSKYMALWFDTRQQQRYNQKWLPSQTNYDPKGMTWTNFLRTTRQWHNQVSKLWTLWVHKKQYNITVYEKKFTIRYYKITWPQFLKKA